MNAPEIVGTASAVGAAATTAAMVGKATAKEISPILSVLLRPAAEVIGKEWRDRLKESFSEAKRDRRDRNLAYHLKRARERVQQSNANRQESPISEKSIQMLDDWTDAVQDVDPADETLSSMWESLFSDIVHGKGSKKIMVAKLRTITPEEAEVLLQFRTQTFLSPTDDLTLFCLQRLTGNQIVQREVGPAAISVFSVLAIIVFGSVMVWFVPGIDGWFSVWAGSKSASLKMLPVAATGLALVVCIIMGLSPKNKFWAWRLTWIGKQLLSYADGVVPQPPIDR